MDNVAMDKRLKGTAASHAVQFNTFYQATVAKKGQELYNAIVRNISEAFNMSHAFIGVVINDEPCQIETLAYLHNAELRNNFVYNLKHTPCEDAFNQRLCYVHSDVATLYPNDALLRDNGIESYLGVCLVDSKGRRLGVIGCFDTAVKLAELDADLHKLLILFAERVSRQLELHKAEYDAAQMRKDLDTHARQHTACEIASGIAHQINQPLTALCLFANGCMEKLQQEHASPEAIALLSKVQALASRCGTVVHEVRDFLQFGTLNKTECDINMIIDEVLLFLKYDFIKHNIRVETDYSAGPTTSNVDRLQLYQVFLNIANNAIDALQSVSNTDAYFKVSTITQNGNIVLDFADNAGGVDPDYMTSLFEPFTSTKPAGIGMGIGLSLAHSVVEAHNGTISVESSAKGAKFIITLPITS